jgi:hypothetical protein
MSEDEWKREVALERGSLYSQIQDRKCSLFSKLMIFPGFYS